MMNKKLLNGIIVVAVAAVFYILGALVGWPMKGDEIAGDIGKAKKSKTQVVNIDKEALQEKMLKDTAFSKEALNSIGMMQLEALNFEAMLQISQKMAKDDSVFNNVLEQMKQMEPTIHNVNLAINELTKDMENLSKGQKVENFEQNFNNAVLSYALLDRAVKVSDNFNDVLNKKEAVSQELDFLGSLWSSAKVQHNVINNMQTEDCKQAQFAEMDNEQFAQLTKELSQNCEEGLQNSFVNYAMVNYTLYNPAVLKNWESITNADLIKMFEKLANTQSLQCMRDHKINYFVVFNNEKINYFIAYNFEKLNSLYRAYNSERLAGAHKNQPSTAVINCRPDLFGAFYR